MFPHTFNYIIFAYINTIISRRIADVNERLKLAVIKCRELNENHSPRTDKELHKRCFEPRKSHLLQNWCFRLEANCLSCSSLIDGIDSDVELREDEDKDLKANASRRAACRKFSDDMSLNLT